MSEVLTMTSPTPPLAAHLVNAAVHCCDTALPRDVLQQRAATDVLRQAAALQGGGGQRQSRTAGRPSTGNQRLPCSPLRSSAGQHGPVQTQDGFGCRPSRLAAA